MLVGKDCSLPLEFENCDFWLSKKLFDTITVFERTYLLMQDKKLKLFSLKYLHVWQVWLLWSLSSILSPTLSQT